MNPSPLPPDDSRAARDTNPDPITGEHGAHPVGTGVGAASGGTAGAAIGAMAGPVGAMLGAAIGAIVGGFVGKATGEAIDPTGEVAYWKENHEKQPYHDDAHTFSDYEPAYRAGVEARNAANAETTFDQAEPTVSAAWAKTKGESPLGWDKARHAAKAAYDRIEASGGKV